jgi:hypothetical protein
MQRIRTNSPARKKEMTITVPCNVHCRRVVVRSERRRTCAEGRSRSASESASSAATAELLIQATDVVGGATLMAQGPTSRLVYGLYLQRTVAGVIVHLVADASALAAA